VADDFTYEHMGEKLKASHVDASKFDAFITNYEDQGQQNNSTLSGIG
jgi:hypothetical protein